MPGEKIVKTNDFDEKKLEKKEKGGKLLFLIKKSEEKDKNYYENHIFSLNYYIFSLKY